MTLDLKRAREALALTQKELADRLGVHVDSVRHWERGRVPMSKPASNLLERLLRQKRLKPSAFLSTVGVDAP